MDIGVARMLTGPELARLDNVRQAEGWLLLVEVGEEGGPAEWLEVLAVEPSADEPGMYELTCAGDVLTIGAGERWPAVVVRADAPAVDVPVSPLRNTRLAALAGGRTMRDGWEPDTPTHRYALVERDNRCDDHWITTHPSIEAAAYYSGAQGDADTWDPILLVDLDTLDSFRGERTLSAVFERQVAGEWRYVVTVTAGTRQEADTVMVERLGCDEDYGFEYAVGWESA